MHITSKLTIAIEAAEATAIKTSAVAATEKAQCTTYIHINMRRI